MSSISTTLCEAIRIEVGPVKFRQYRYRDREPDVFATQTIVVTTHDGNHFQLCIHLAEGVTALVAAEPVVFPALYEVPA